MVNEVVVRCVTCLDDLKQLSGQSIKLTTPTGKQKGSLFVRGIDIVPVPTFSDYLRNGIEISLIGAIDFTYSNGAPSNPNSLHYISQDKKN
jgi:hypothetical protein